MFLTKSIWTPLPYGLAGEVVGGVGEAECDMVIPSGQDMVGT